MAILWLDILPFPRKLNSSKNFTIPFQFGGFLLYTYFKETNFIYLFTTSTICLLQRKTEHINQQKEKNKPKNPGETNCYDFSTHTSRHFPIYTYITRECQLQNFLKEKIANKIKLLPLNTSQFIFEAQITHVVFHCSQHLNVRDKLNIYL